MCTWKRRTNETICSPWRNFSAMNENFACSPVPCEAFLRLPHDDVVYWVVEASVAPGHHMVYFKHPNAQPFGDFGEPVPVCVEPLCDIPC